MIIGKELKTKNQNDISQFKRDYNRYTNIFRKFYQDKSLEFMKPRISTVSEFLEQYKREVVETGELNVEYYLLKIRIEMLIRDAANSHANVNIY